MGAGAIPQLEVISTRDQAVLSSQDVIWISTLPGFEFPRRAICPLPEGLFLKVIATQPGLAYPKFSHSIHDEVVGDIGVDGGQVGTLLLAERLSVSPVLLGSAPEVAVVPILLPALATRCHAFRI